MGRTVSGLPCDRAEFATLPPFFSENSVEIAEAVEIAFPTLPKRLQKMGEMGLASVLYHDSFLRRTLPATHMLFSTVVYTQSRLFSRFRRKVCCRVATPEDPMKPTGIPPHISLLSQMKDMYKEFEQVTPKMIGAIRREFETRAFETGHLTSSRMEELLKGVLETTGLLALVRDDAPGRNGATETQEETQEHRIEASSITINDALRYTPRNLQIPTCTCGAVDHTQLPRTGLLILTTLHK